MTKGHQSAKPLRERLRRKLSPARNAEVWKGHSFAAAGRKLKLRGHPDQFRQRFSLHLPHHVPAMDLYGDFAGSEFKRYLLIKHARNNETHDFALARG